MAFEGGLLDAYGYTVNFEIVAFNKPIYFSR